MTTDTRAAGDLLRLDRQICFSLHAASRAFNGVYRTVLADLGLTYPQYLVMLTLWEDDGLPVKEIGDRLRLDSGTLSPLLKRLETAGYITRRRSEHDERSVVITLTMAGDDLRAEAAGIPLRMAKATGLTLDELQTLRTLLTTVTENLDEADL
ncbi:MarR family winged helix-turn-helix transcriptional regulator [Actinomadura rupiterrae]|uniref:MarR family winged helix-turn-helix transcriptional regulator n=1 Tax=Actinomadura rupiterrae TaxID=559627 RepID=UPI0020A4AA0D|nr:MarR family transcriptional regulator [Actinomadura rupiterrae]MCP2335884.1 DNA-binding MarR family transcriptional regulator [Actinomadura rupiterrae]